MEKLTYSKYPEIAVYKIRKTEIDKIDFDLCQQPAETLEHYYERQSIKPDLLVNGGFFALSTGETTFTYIDDGEEVSINKDYLEGFGIKDNTIEFGTYANNYSDFISAYPIFMKAGNAVSSSVGSEINYNARRTILGYDEFFIYVIIIESPGYAFSRIKGMLNELRIPNAINLDGGGSTRLLLNGKRETAMSYSRPVDNVVAIYLKKEKIIYRVQTGAFSKKDNAERYKAEIQKLPDSIGAGYKNAYIKLINGLYKVQVGAFSKKENAQKVVTDLKRLGYDSFITTNN